ncbi:MAG: signal peptidase I [Epulopiscium sp. Nuni2H_MBin003]|nr:MAG: signal peptidase I [Epulopiscium sp. Nuni2H_MBin003]
MKKILTFFGELFTIWAIVLFFTTFVVQMLRIAGDSMDPTLVDNQWVIINKIYYNFSEPQIGDVIGFRVPEIDVDIVKRIVAVEGDVIDFVNGGIYINDVPMADNSTLIYNKGDIHYPFTVPTNHYFMLGDNIQSSIDSRYVLIGTITKENIIGKIIAIGEIK